MRTLLQFLLKLLTLAAIGWAIWQGIALLRQEQLGLAPGVRPVMIIVAILCIICVFMVTMAIDSHGRHVYASRQFEARYALYQRCINDPGIEDLEVELALLASPKVLKAFEELHAVAAGNGLNTEAGREACRKLVLAMREDLGVRADPSLKQYLFRTSNNYNYNSYGNKTILQTEAEGQG